MAGADFQRSRRCPLRGPAIEGAHPGAGETGRARRPVDCVRKPTGFHETLAVDVARANRRGREARGMRPRYRRLQGSRTNEPVRSRQSAPHRGRGVYDRRFTPAIAFRIGGDEFAVILPESGRIDAEGPFARLQASLRRRPLAPRPGAEPLRRDRGAGPDDDGVSLFERAEQPYSARRRPEGDCGIERRRKRRGVSPAF